MWIKSLTTINWANLPNGTLDLAQITMITGGTGVGKTTLLDAIQTLMTAGHHELCRYNPGQDEATSRSRTKKSRTLASYVLGCDDGRYARPGGAHAYIMARLVPAPGEDGEAFTALVGFTAQLRDEGGERIAHVSDERYLVFRDCAPTKDDLVRTDDDGRVRVRPLDEAVGHLRYLYPQAAIDPSVSKTDFLQQLYGALNGKRSLGEGRAKKAARQFSRFLVYKPIQRLDSFVREEILESVDMRQQLDDVSALMRNIQNMRDEAQRISDGVGALESTHRSAGRLIRSLADAQMSRLEEKLRTRHRSESRLKDLEHKQQALQRKQTALADELRGVEQSVARAESHLADLRESAEGSEAIQTQARLEKDIERQQKARGAAAGRLLDANTTRDRNQRLFQSLSHHLGTENAWTPGPVSDGDWGSLLREALEADTWADRDIAGLLRDGTLDDLLAEEAAARAIESAQGKVVGALRERHDAIDRAYFDADTDVTRKKAERERLEAEIDELLRHGRAPYPRATRELLEALALEMPGSNPRVVCDHIEVNDRDWQMAIEGFFGGARFAVVVDRSYESRAIGLVNRLGLRGVRIEQGGRAEDSARDGKAPVKPGSIVELMRFTDPTVEAVVKARYGNVIQVADNDALTRTSRGLTRDGNAATGYSMFFAAAEESSLVFGQGARERSARAKQQRLRALADEAEAASSWQRVLGRWRDAAASAAKTALVEPLEALAEAQMEIVQARERLASLDLGDAEETMARMRAQQAEIKSLRARQGELNRDLGNIVGQIGATREAHEAETAHAQDAAVAAQTQNERVARFWTVAGNGNDYGYDWKGRRDQIDEALSSEAAAIQSPSPNRLMGLGEAVSKAALQFNGYSLYGMKVRAEGFSSADSELDNFSHVVDTFRDAADLLGKLRDNILVENREALDKASREFNSTFIRDVCLRMNNCIDKGRDRLEQLNLQLRNQTFGEEFYQFEWRWRSEYKGYADFFRHMAEADAADGSLLDDSGLRAQDEEIFTTLKTLLLDADQNRAMRELHRLTDYREYRDYDIIKRQADDPSFRISLKTYGTGSGGQLETPSYVVRSAALATALGWDEGRTHLRFVMIDESFSKLDVQRCKEVISYLTGALGLQLLFVIPDKSSGHLHAAVDLLIDVAKVDAEQPRGELKTRVHLQSSLLNRERVQALDERERRRASAAAARNLNLDFLNEGGQAPTPAETDQ